MISAEYGLLFFAAAGFLLILLVLTQIVPGRQQTQSDLLADDEATMTDQFLRSVAPQELEPAGGPFKRIDNSFAEMIDRGDTKMSAEQALSLMLVMGVIGAIVMYFWKGMLWLTALGFFVGVGLILAYFMVKAMGYRRRLQNQLPDALFMIARSVRSGMALEQAIDVVAQQGVQPLAGEFRRAAQQIRLGLSIPVALQRTANRIRLLDFDAFVSTVAVYSRTGGNLPLLLDRLAASARDHNQFRGFFFASTAQARVTAIFIGLAAPVLLLAYAILDPEHLQTFFRRDTGWLILGGCLLVEAIGAYWLYRMLKVEYF